MSGDAIQYERLLANLPGMVYRCRPDEQRTMEFVSAGCRALTGLEPRDLIGDTAPAWGELVHPDDRDGALDEISRAVSERRPYQLVYRLRRPDGEERWVSELGAGEYDYGDEPLALEGFVSDITDLRRAEESREEIQRRYRALFENSLDLVFVMGLDGQFLEANQRALDLLGYAPEEVTSVGFTDLVDEKDVPRVLKEMVHLQEHGSNSRPNEYRLRTRDGRRVWVEAAAARVDRNGEPVALLGIAREITERKRTEQALRRAEEHTRLTQKMEAIGRLAGGVAHDFSNSLATIQGHAELLLLDLPPDAPHRIQIEKIASASGRAIGLTRRLLELSRERPAERRAVDLAELLRDTREILERLAGEDVRLDIEPGSRAVPVLADPAQLEQLLLNLTSNAKDAMPDGGRLAISVEKTEGAEKGILAEDADLPCGVLKFVDSGCGMDAETRSRAFEPFFTTRPDRSGLGLSSAYGVARAGGGGIAVHSEPGRGSTFEVYLPLARGRAAAGKRGVEDATLARCRGTVLVVEDEEMLRDLVVRVLERCGCEVITATSGEQALELGRRLGGELDLLLADVVMPGLHGGELAALLDQSNPDLRVLFMSGHADDTIVGHGVRRGEVDMIDKPFTATQLARRVQRVLRRRGETSSLS
ncbi:MAG: PAS domain S-box protein [Polyangia bacterium]